VSQEVSPKQQNPQISTGNFPLSGSATAYPQRHFSRRDAAEGLGVSEARPSLIYACGQWEIDLGQRELRAAGSPVPLGSRAFEIVEVLVRSASSLVTKDDLMQRVWPGATVGEATLHVHISAVRKALGRDRHLVKTAQGRGYRLLGGWAIRQHPSVGASVIPFPRASGVVATSPLSDVEKEISSGNLPIPVTELFGRSAASALICERLSAYRVVTLTGPGGIGKTSLALFVAHERRTDFGDGTFLVELASLSNPELLPSAVAADGGPKTPRCYPFLRCPSHWRRQTSLAAR
jgi:DNA-binding winged helix-turn-helix (wHTH) protein